MNSAAQWLVDLDWGSDALPIDGLVPVTGFEEAGLHPEQRAVMEKARAYNAQYVFFEESRNHKPPVAQAFVFLCDARSSDQQFADIHKRLWSWGGVPLVYRKTAGLVQLFRCAHKPDFLRGGKVELHPFDTLDLASTIATQVSSEPWWDAARLYNGTLWDDPKVCKQLLSSRQAAQKTLISEVKRLHTELTGRSLLSKPLRRRLLILSILIAYLEARKVFEDGFFSHFKKGSTKFFQVLADGPALLKLLDHLEERFNGNVFTLAKDERYAIRNNQQLGRFAELVEGRKELGGQLTLWQRYSFADLPVELISHIYQLFVRDAAVAVYTPHFVVRLMLSEVLSWERLDRLEANDEVILDGACGSGVFLVEAYKRLVLHWRYRNNWKRPTEAVLKRLLTKRLRGIDKEAGAVELAAFSLCLALCDALEPLEIRTSVKLFPPLNEVTLHTRDFFGDRESKPMAGQVGVIVGNPPFASNLDTEGAQDAFDRYRSKYGLLPDQQLAYLFLHESMEMLAAGGVISMLQPYSFLYNHYSREFRQSFIERWNVREILDFISVRGIFQKGDADTKVLAIIAEAQRPPPKGVILHATFRRTSRTDAEQGFDLDYYDMHWVPRNLPLENDKVWRSNLLGGGRALAFADRLKKFKSLGQYASEQGWDFGEGFIGGTSGRLGPGSHITDRPLIEPRHLKGGSLTALKRVTRKKFKSAYTERRFQAPMVLVHEHEDLTFRYVPSGYYTYGHKIVGFCAADGRAATIKLLAKWLERNRSALRALVCLTGTTVFTQRASSVGLQNILGLPSPEHDLELTASEQVLVDDILTYYRDLVRLGEGSEAMKGSGVPALESFNEVYTGQINGIYREKPLKALPAQIWPGVICQPFVFRDGTVDWTGAEQLKGKIHALLREKCDGGLDVTRIARIYDGSCIYLLKPDRLRYWLRSIALRDADETLADLVQQGF